MVCPPILYGFIFSVYYTSLSFAFCNPTDSFISLVGVNLDLIQAFQNICDVLLNLMSCVSYDRLQPMNSVEEMMTKANQLQGTNNLFAGNRHLLPNNNGIILVVFHTSDCFVCEKTG